MRVVCSSAERPPVNDRRGGPPREIPVWEKMVTVCREAAAMPDAQIREVSKPLYANFAPDRELFLKVVS